MASYRRRGAERPQTLGHLRLRQLPNPGRAIPNAVCASPTISSGCGGKARYIGRQRGGHPDLACDPQQRCDQAGVAKTSALQLDTPGDRMWSSEAYDRLPRQRPLYGPLVSFWRGEREPTGHLLSAYQAVTAAARCSGFYDLSRCLGRTPKICPASIAEALPRSGITCSQS
jgi:hypothetical protein